MLPPAATQTDHHHPQMSYETSFERLRTSWQVEASISKAIPLLSKSIGNCRSMQNYHFRHSYDADEGDRDRDSDDENTDDWLILSRSINEAIKSESSSRFTTGQTSNDEMANWTLTFPHLIGPSHMTLSSSQPTPIHQLPLPQSLLSSSSISTLPLTTTPTIVTNTHDVPSAQSRDDGYAFLGTSYNTDNNISGCCSSSSRPKTSLCDYLADRWRSSSLSSSPLSVLQQQVRVIPVRIAIDRSGNVTRAQ
jgi:hypothetical protein